MYDITPDQAHDMLRVLSGAVNGYKAAERAMLHEYAPMGYAHGATLKSFTEMRKAARARDDMFVTCKTLGIDEEFSDVFQRSCVGEYHVWESEQMETIRKALEADTDDDDDAFAY